MTERLKGGTRVRGIQVWSRVEDVRGQRAAQLDQATLWPDNWSVMLSKSHTVAYES
jgi:hypothetical protein